MTAIDDLKPGMFIAVTQLGRQEDTGFGGMDFAMFGRPRAITYSGQPLEVLAVSLPFVSVTDGRQVCAIDVRDARVQKLDRRYVAAMTADATKAIENTNRKRRRKKKSKPDPTLCPRCKCGKLIQRLIVKPAGNEWSLACTQCGYQGEVVSA
jgi:hypothetical protein